MGPRCSHRHRVAPVVRRRHRQRGGHLPRPPVRRGTPDGRDPGALEARRVDAGPARLHQTPGARVHGRGVRVRAADGDATGEEADPDPLQAGAGVRRRGRARHTEPCRPRLQGDLQRRHLDDRPPPDRARQGPTPRRHEFGGRHRRPRHGRRDDLVAREARVPAPHHRRQTAPHLRRAVGNELPRRPHQQRPGPEVARTGGRGWLCDALRSRRHRWRHRHPATRRGWRCHHRTSVHSRRRSDRRSHRDAQFGPLRTVGA